MYCWSLSFQGFTVQDAGGVAQTTMAWTVIKRSKVYYVRIHTYAYTYMSSYIDTYLHKYTTYLCRHTCIHRYKTNRQTDRQTWLAGISGDCRILSLSRVGSKSAPRRFLPGSSRRPAPRKWPRRRHAVHQETCVRGKFGGVKHPEALP